MKKNIHHIVINIKSINVSFKYWGYTVNNIVYGNSKIIVLCEKDYSENYNIEFNGKIKLKAEFDLNLSSNFASQYFPKFYEYSNIIPKNNNYHIYNDGSICYAPPIRPLLEKWQIIDFVSAVNSMISNYFAIEYIGRSTLKELEHGIIGLYQYLKLKNKYY